MQEETAPRGGEDEEKHGRCNGSDSTEPSASKSSPLLGQDTCRLSLSSHPVAALNFFFIDLGKK